MTEIKADNLPWYDKQILEYFKYSFKRLDLYDGNASINECDFCSADIPSRDYGSFCSDECREEHNLEREMKYYDFEEYEPL